LLEFANSAKRGGTILINQVDFIIDVSSQLFNVQLSIAGHIAVQAAAMD